MRDTQAPVSTPTRLGSSGMICFKTGEVVSGFNKVCTYNCGGSAAATTISAVDLCPLSMN